MYTPRKTAYFRGSYEEPNIFHGTKGFERPTIHDKLKPSRRSANTTTAVPKFNKELNLLLHAADKEIIARSLADSQVTHLRGHTDVITTLDFDPKDSHILISGGLDGKIIKWDLRTLGKTQQYKVNFPIFFLDGLIAGTQISNKYCLCKYDSSSFLHYTTLFSSSIPFNISVGANGQFIAVVSGLRLFIYWVGFGASLSYSLPAADKLNVTHKSFTSISAHPTDFVLATGNSLGEIFVWYNFTAKTTNFENETFPLFEPEEDSVMPSRASSVKNEKSEITETTRLSIEVLQKFTKNVGYYPIHPSRTKRNLVHWHHLPVTTLCFTPSGSHLLSGGLEGVVVKWDMTESYGDSKLRRFLPRLGSPISAVACPGGPSEDTVIITLANNGFHLLGGDMSPVYSHQGFVQFPSVWYSQIGHTLPSNFITLSSAALRKGVGANNRYFVLTNGAMGNLQLMDPLDERLPITKFDVTNQSLAPRSRESRIPIVYSEVHLVEYSSANGWLATYERLVPESLTQVDDQSRITWWLIDELEDEPSCQNSVPHFSAVDAFSLSYLHCPATDMGFLSSPDKEFYLLLRDLRLLVWRAEPAYTRTSNYVPWNLYTCLQLRDSIPPHLKANDPHAMIIADTALNPAELLSNRNPLFLLTLGTTMAVFNWSDLVKTASVPPLVVFDLNTRDYVHPEYPAGSFCLKSIHPKPAVLPQTSKSSTELLVLTARGHRIGEKKLMAFGLLYLVSLRKHQADGWKANVEAFDPDVLAMSVRAHPTRQLVAVGLQDGTAGVWEVLPNEADGYQMTRLISIPSIPPYPICDRQSHTDVSKKRRVDSDSRQRTDTCLLALDFLPRGLNQDPEDLCLVGLSQTLSGRQCGRRDVLLYGAKATPPLVQKFPTSVPNKVGHLGGVLQLVEPALSPSGVAAGPPPDMDSDPMKKQITDALRQVSQYPTHAAPPPEQLLRQLMKKIN